MLFANLFEACPKHWKIVPFEIAIDFQEGPGILAVDFHDDGIPLIRLSGVQRRTASLVGCNYLDPEKVTKKWHHFRLSLGDLLISTSASIGMVSEIGDETVGAIAYTGLIRLRPRSAEVCSGFIKQFVSSSFFIHQAASVAVGSVLSHFGPTHLRQMAFPLPPLPEQIAIAAILGSLDDKIELNRRMNATLKAMARALFQSWFVDFDPVRAKMDGRAPVGMDAETAALFPDSFEDSALGKIPKGWEVTTVGDVGIVICGKTPSTAVLSNYGDDIPFVTIPDMHGNIFCATTARKLSISGAASQANKMLPPGSICVSCIATPGLVLITTKPSQSNQQINSIVCHRENENYFWYWVMIFLGPEIASGGSGGSVLINLSKSRFETLQVLKPPHDIVATYHKAVRQIFETILANSHQSHSLAAVRDTLLPKLLSGEVVDFHPY
jgi:type I restriction enzyme, S subunit